VSIYGRLHWDRPAPTITRGFYCMCMATQDWICVGASASPGEWRHRKCQAISRAL
jgi:hypothetical protein